MWFYSLFKAGTVEKNDGIRLTRTFEELENVLNGRLDGQNFKKSSIGERELGTPVLKIKGGTYTGDDTANRVINVGFRPVYVEILATTDFNVFEGMSDGIAPTAKWYRTNTGALQGSNNDWQGIVIDVTNKTYGFKTGSNTASLSNKNGQSYVYTVIGY